MPGRSQQPQPATAVRRLIYRPRLHGGRIHDTAETRCSAIRRLHASPSAGQSAASSQAGAGKATAGGRHQTQRRADTVVCTHRGYTETVIQPNARGKPGIRLCIDMTRLNDAVLREQYTLPVIDQLLARLACATVFSKLDCNSGFHQIKLSSKLQLLITFTAPFGRFCYTRAPFGISSAVEVFSKKMADILNSQDNALCVIDDVMVYGKDQAEHDARLIEVLDRFRRANITLNDKCEFSKSQIKWAGHIISGDGISVDPDRLSAVLNMPPPTDVSTVRTVAFLAWSIKWPSSQAAWLSYQRHYETYCARTARGCGTRRNSQRSKVSKRQ